MCQNDSFTFSHFILNRKICQTRWVCHHRLKYLNSPCVTCLWCCLLLWDCCISLQLYLQNMSSSERSHSGCKGRPPAGPGGAAGAGLGFEQHALWMNHIFFHFLHHAIMICMTCIHMTCSGDIQYTWKPWMAAKMTFLQSAVEDAPSFVELRRKEKREKENMEGQNKPHEGED